MAKNQNNDQETTQELTKTGTTALADAGKRATALVRGIVDHPQISYTAFAVRGSRHGVPQERFVAGLDAIQAALDEARAAIAAAYENPEVAKPGRVIEL